MSQNRKQAVAARRRKRAFRCRRGGAAVEAALIFPIIIILMMGTLEICAGLYLKESLTVCAFEGVRVGIRRRGTPQMIEDRVLEVLEERNITVDSDTVPGCGITITPDDFSDLKAMDPVTVTVVAPATGNCAFIFGHLMNGKVSASVTMVREFDE